MIRCFPPLGQHEKKLHQSKGQQLINRLGYTTSATPGLIIIISPRQMVFSIIQLVPPCQERWSSASYCWCHHAKRDGLQHHTVGATMPREMVFSIIPLVPPCQERWSSASYCWCHHAKRDGLQHHTVGATMPREMVFSIIPY